MIVFPRRRAAGRYVAPRLRSTACWCCAPTIRFSDYLPVCAAALYAIITMVVAPEVTAIGDPAPMIELLIVRLPVWCGILPAEHRGLPSRMADSGGRTEDARAEDSARS
jgi:hypothetical protein